MFENDTPKDKLAWKMQDIADELKDMATGEDDDTEEQMLIDIADKLERFADFLARG